MKVDSGRVTNPPAISREEVSEELQRWGKLVIQFDREQAYSPALLSDLNGLCRHFGDALTVRFFGHYRNNTFDAANLQYLPDVKSLGVNCLLQIKNEDILAELDQLVRLDFGVYEFDRPAFLSRLPLERLLCLSVDQTRKRNLDLAPLADCARLETLAIEGHVHGIGAVAGLPRLRKVTLRSFPSSARLHHFNHCPRLEWFKLILGGRPNLDEFQSDSLHTLIVLRVLGIRDLGAMTRFPRLRRLQVEDQGKLAQLDLQGVALHYLWLVNCKGLSSLLGLEVQRDLRQFVASRVALDFAALRDFPWPTGAECVSLNSANQKWNEATKAALTERGHGNDISWWFI